MVAILLFLVSALRAVIEAAGLCLLGQGILWLLAGPSRGRNAIYRLFKLLTLPVLGLLRAILPRAIVDRYIPPVGFFLLFLMWIFLAYLRQVICAANGVACP